MPISSPSDATGKRLEELRTEHQVRLIAPEEQGVAIDRLPAGVYGFTYAPGNDTVPLFAKQDYHSFEIHKASDGSVHVIGFLTDQEEARLSANEPGATIRLFPEPWEDATRLVSVLKSRAVTSKRGLPRENGNPLPFTIA